MRAKQAILLSILGLAGLTACDSTLETGYKYSRLDMTDSEQKAMYADPFSQAAAEAHQDQQQESTARRPGTPGGAY
jgi:hypothetical protein